MNTEQATEPLCGGWERQQVTGHLDAPNPSHGASQFSVLRGSRETEEGTSPHSTGLCWHSEPSKCFSRCGPPPHLIRQLGLQCSQDIQVLPVFVQKRGSRAPGVYSGSGLPLGVGAPMWPHWLWLPETQGGVGARVAQGRAEIPQAPSRLGWTLGNHDLIA